MPTETWKTNSISSIRGKLTFIFNTFIIPYLQEDEKQRALSTIGIQVNTLNANGIIRFRYSHDGSTINSEADMNAFFNGKNVESQRLISTVYEADSSNDDTKFAYEYVGYITIDEEGDYVFGVNSDDAVDVYVDRMRVAYWYSSGSHTYKIPETTPGGTTSTKKLAPGQYPIRVRYVRSTNGNARLNLLWKKATDTDFSGVPCDKLFHDPSVMSSTVSLVGDQFDQNDIISNILDFDRFVQYFGTTSSTLTSSIRTNITKVKISNNNSPYANYNTNTSTIPSIDNTEPNVIKGDINFQEFLNTVRTVSNGNKIQVLINFMQSVRLLYNLLDDEMIENMKAGNPISVPGYNIDPVTFRTIVYNATNVESMFPGLVAMLNKFTRVEYFIFRRILLLIDLVMHSHICMFLFNQFFALENDANKDKISSMIIFFIQRLKHLNSNFGVMFESRVDQDNNSLVSNLYANVREFNQRTEDINVLDREVKESKNALKTKNNILKNEKSLSEKSNKWLLFAFIVTIIIIVTLASYAILAKTSPSLKWVGAGSTALFSALVALSFYFIKTKKMEGFSVSGGIYQEQLLSEILEDADALNTINSAYYVDTMKEMDTYIQNTINMALILQNNNAYKYINYNLQKEANYYNGAKVQINNSTAIAGASERMYNLNTRNNLSKMNTFIALIIILTFAVVGYVLADGYVTIQYIVMIVSSVLLLIVAILYILDTQSKVRTNGTKVYWGQPNEMLQKLK